MDEVDAGIAEAKEMSMATEGAVRAASYRACVSKQKSSDEEDESDENSSGDSSSDSETPWKRKKREKPKLLKPVRPTSMQRQTSSNRSVKKNNIWAAVLSEQSLSEEISSFSVNNDEFVNRSRSVESYNYPRRKEQTVNEPVAKLLQSRKRHRSRPLDYSKTETNEEIAFKIANRLDEPKHDLIERVIDEVGPKKAVELLQATEEIEAMGGMMVNNGSRRRTPGGVFFQLLRTNVEADKLDNIFKEEKQNAEQRKKKKKSLKRRQQASETAKLVDLPTRTELMMQETKDAELKKGESELEKEDGELDNSDVEPME